MWSLMKIKLMLLPQATYCSEGGCDFWSLMKIKLIFFLPQSTYCSERVANVIPHEDKVDVITPINILFRGGCDFWSLMKIKLMFLPQSRYCSAGVADFDPSWRYSWFFLPQSTYCSERVANVIPHEDKVDVIAPINILFRGIFDPSWR